MKHHPETNLFTDPTVTTGYPQAVRSQADNQGDTYSWETALDTGEETLVRAEYAREADINYILESYGLAQTQRPIQWGGEVDYTLDLQKAMMATEQAESAHRTIPAELKNKYPTYREWLNAINSGEYMSDLQDLTERKKAAAEKAAAEKAEAAKETPAEKAPASKKDTKDSPKAD